MSMKGGVDQNVQLIHQMAEVAMETCEFDAPKMAVEVFSLVKGGSHCLSRLCAHPIMFLIPAVFHMIIGFSVHIKKHK